MNYYKLEIVSTGGEYCCGVVKDKQDIKFIKKLMKENELNLHNYDAKTNQELNFYEYDDILHVYGPTAVGLK